MQSEPPQEDIPRPAGGPAAGPTAGGTYRTLDEQEGRLSPAEERFERRRRWTSSPSSTASPPS